MKNKLNLSTKRLDYLVLFILDAAGMTLELVAARLMSPYFGNSNFVWTAIIGIILLAGSLGNLIGGKIASFKLARLYTSMLLLFAAIYLVVMLIFDMPILEAIRDSGSGVQFASVLGSIIFFLIPSTILGIITPIIMKEHIAASADKGKESGRITAIIAIGSLVGTFVGGFWLIPALGTKMTFIVLAIIIALSTILFSPFKNLAKNFKSKIPFLALLVVSFLTILFAGLKINSDTLDSKDISIDTEYGRVIIEDGYWDKEPVRYYKQSGAYSSATFLREQKRFDLVFDYLKKYDEMFKFLDVKDAAMIGGAAYQYPKYYISHFPDKNMDVIEIDPDATKIAKQCFFLDDLISEYNLNETERLGLYNDDGRVFLASSNKKYDAILNDAFSGEVPVATLATVEAAQVIKDSLNSDGVYISNVLGAINGEKGRFLRSEVLTLKKVFQFVYIIPTEPNVKTTDFRNWIVIATDNSSYIPKNHIIPQNYDEALILTDDHCPIDALTATDYFEE